MTKNLTIFRGIEVKSILSQKQTDVTIHIPYGKKLCKLFLKNNVKERKSKKLFYIYLTDLQCFITHFYKGDVKYCNNCSSCHPDLTF